MEKHCDGKDFNFLIGKSIIKVKQENGKCGRDIFKLICDDDTIIEIETNDGCGGCCNGWSSFDDLKKLEQNHNTITNVVCKYDGNSCIENDKFKLFIYYQDDVLTLNGNDGYGNGYYGGGFYVTIKNIND